MICTHASGMRFARSGHEPHGCLMSKYTAVRTSKAEISALDGLRSNWHQPTTSNKAIYTLLLFARRGVEKIAQLVGRSLACPTRGAMCLAGGCIDPDRRRVQAGRKEVPVGRVRQQPEPSSGECCNAGQQGQPCNDRWDWEHTPVNVASPAQIWIDRSIVPSSRPMMRSV